jgi:hypothetical protein
MATPTLIQLYNFYADQKWWDGPFKYVVCTTWTRKKNLLNLRLTYNMVLLYGEWTLQDMVPSARLLVYHVSHGGHIAADSLTFPVIPTPAKEVIPPLVLKSYCMRASEIYILWFFLTFPHFW